VGELVGVALLVGVTLGVRAPLREAAGLPLPEGVGATGVALAPSPGDPDARALSCAAALFEGGGEGDVVACGGAVGAGVPVAPRGPEGVAVAAAAEAVAPAVGGAAPVGAGAPLSVADAPD
jgi:hypothetical protein